MPVQTQHRLNRQCDAFIYYFIFLWAFLLCSAMLTPVRLCYKLKLLILVNFFVVLVAFVQSFIDKRNFRRNFMTNVVWLYTTNFVGIGRKLSNVKNLFAWLEYKIKYMKSVSYTYICLFKSEHRKLYFLFLLCLKMIVLFLCGTALLIQRYFMFSVSLRRSGIPRNRYRKCALRLKRRCIVCCD